MTKQAKKEKPIVQIVMASLHEGEYNGETYRYLRGHAINHPRQELNGIGGVTTSKILDIRDEGKTVETLNTIYKLVDDRQFND